MFVVPFMLHQSLEVIELRKTWPIEKNRVTFTVINIYKNILYIYIYTAKTAALFNLIKVVFWATSDKFS